MSSQNEKSGSLEPSEKLIVLVGITLTVLSVLALAIFVTLSVVSLATWTVLRFWNVCFYLCAISCGGWMVLYTGQLRIGGGVFLRRNNVLLLLSLILAVSISTVVRFAGHQRYIAIAALVLLLALFHVAVPTSPSALLRLVRTSRLPSRRPEPGSLMANFSYTSDDWSEIWQRELI